MAKESIEAMCAFIRKKAKVGKSGKRCMKPIKAFRALALSLPEFQSQEAAQEALKGMDVKTLADKLLPPEKAFCEANSGNAVHLLYFCYLSLVRSKLAAWLIKNEMVL